MRRWEKGLNERRPRVQREKGDEMKGELISVEVAAMHKSIEQQLRAAVAYSCCHVTSCCVQFSSAAEAECSVLGGRLRRDRDRSVNDARDWLVSCIVSRDVGT